MNKRYTLEAAEKLARFDRPTLFAWAPEDRIFKLSYAERLAETIPDAKIETIDDAKTFVSLDQPRAPGGDDRRLCQGSGAGAADLSRSLLPPLTPETLRRG